MLIADNWKEYEILDSGDGAKLEKWGKEPNSFILSRPDPQVLWPKEKPGLWSKADGTYTRTKASGKWDFIKQLPGRSQINCDLPGQGNLKFWIKPTDFKHMGLFPEQVVNWTWMTEQIKNAKSKEQNYSSKIKILNLFAYTGGATIACAKAGADVTHVDASKGMVDWASENAKLNNVEAKWIVDDVSKFVLREKRRGAKYDAVIMDPPSYGKGTKGETWKIEKMLWPLVKNSTDLLENEPLFFLINSYTSGLGPTVIGNILNSALGNYNGTITTNEITLPISGSQKLLGAGVSGRWQKK